MKREILSFFTPGVELPFPTPRTSDVWLLKFINSAWPIWRTFGPALYYEKGHQNPFKGVYYRKNLH